MCWINQINHKVDNSKGRGRREKMSIPFLYILKLAQKSTRTDDSCETQQKKQPNVNVTVWKTFE